MAIQNKTVLVLGGWGLVGSAICRKLMEEKPRRIVVTSLRESEAKEAVEHLRQEYPRTGRNFFVPWWGNIFVRHTLKDIGREEILNDPAKRRMLIDDLLDEFSAEVLNRSSIHRIMDE